MPVCTDYNVSKVTPEGSKRCSNERSKRIAEASALALALEEEEIVLPEEQKQAKQPEVTPEAKRSKRCSNERSKRIAEASALALALEEEEIVLPEGSKRIAEASVLLSRLRSRSRLFVDRGAAATLVIVLLQTGILLNLLQTKIIPP